MADPSSEPTSTLDTTRRKLITFVCICAFQTVTFLNFNLPYSFLPLYNEERNITTAWTGVILGGSPIGLIFGPIFLATFLLTKFTTPVVMSVSAACLGVLTMLFSLLDFVHDLNVFKFLAVLDRFLIGMLGGCINTIIFAALLAIYPNKVGLVTAIGEAVLNGAVAFAPFIGAVLYSSSGLKLAFIVPGALVLVSAVPALFFPNISNKDHENEQENEEANLATKNWSSFLDPWLLFPLWHLTFGQILMTYHMPLLSVYAEHMFGADVVWSGTVQLVSTAVVCISSPLLGMLIDKFGPCKMMLASCVSLPVVYVCVGPLPLLSFISPSRTQLITSLAFLGLAVPMACISALPVMFDVYRAKNHGNLPTWVANFLVSLYCAAFPVGIFIGTTVSGFVVPYA
ncbi:MFS-type transporter SLC18B1-like, partial [Bolinopsis microptera]|uniref:MFS-type transporter SLC18B1-like n=1 Tax=Bolinopsis microptera TaxID=2820187 RepID=UPI00307AEBB7